MRILFGRRLRRIRISLAVGICGSFILFGTAVQSAAADHPWNPWEWNATARLGRILGVGWGDGYHVCAHPPRPLAPYRLPSVVDVARWEPAASEERVVFDRASGPAAEGFLPERVDSDQQPPLSDEPLRDPEPLRAPRMRPVPLPPVGDSLPRSLPHPSQLDSCSPRTARTAAPAGRLPPVR